MMKTLLNNVCILPCICIWQPHHQAIVLNFLVRTLLLFTLLQKKSIFCDLMNMLLFMLFWLLYRALSRWREVRKVLLFVILSSSPCRALCPWKHNEIFKCSTTWCIHFILPVLHPLSTPALAAKVSVKRGVCLSLVKAALAELLGRNLTWFIKWNRRAMHVPLNEMLQKHTNANYVTDSQWRSSTH